MMETLHLFPKIDEHIIQVLRSMSAEEWHKPTLAKAWTIKDIASHLLDVTMRDVSIYRDGYAGPSPQHISSYDDLVNYLNTMNAVWVDAYRRVSPKQIIDQLVIANEEQYKQLAKLDLQAPAIYSVAWAGETTSVNAFHIARLYTEKFHHQLQIRDAIGKADVLMTRELYYPFITTLLMGLPHTYRHMHADTGTSIGINILTAIGGSWHIIRENGKWIFHEGPASSPQATVTLQPDIAWKLFTKGLGREEAMNNTVIEGEYELGVRVLNLVAVMASSQS